MDRKKEDILNKLKKSGPGFTVPKAYFENLEDRVEHFTVTADIHQERHKENYGDQVAHKDSLRLKQIGKDHGFIAPDGYFDSLESKISGPKNPKVIPLKNQFIRILSLSIAASILLFFGLNYMNTNQEATSELVFNDEELINWVESDLVNFNSYEIAEAFNDVELEHALYAEDELDEYLNSVDIEKLILENK